MTLVKRGRVWHTRIEVDGKLYQKSLKTRKRSEAIKHESAFRIAIVRGEFDILDTGGTPTLEGFRKRLFAHLKATVRERTYQWYEDYFNTLTRFNDLAKTRLNRIDTPLIEQFIQWRLNGKDKPQIITVNHSLRTLRRALHQAEEWKLIRRAPKIKLLRGENSREYVVSEDTLKLMIDWIAKAYPTSLMQHLLPFLV